MQSKQLDSFLELCGQLLRQLHEELRCSDPQPQPEIFDQLDNQWH
jgi:hypothetical protein